MKNPSRHLALAALAVFAAGTAACKSTDTREMTDHEKHQDQVFAEVDQDENKALDAAEFSTYFYTISFTHHDADGNEQITLIEWAGPAPAAMHRTLFSEMDADSSDWLTITEYSSHPTRNQTVINAFMTMDRNGDSIVEYDEIVTIAD
jgi:Ca2+-binding EF-hand superfamily protein